MPEIRFYHLNRTSLRDALPQLLNKAIGGGKRVIVRVADDVATEKLAGELWTYHPDTFLPHGTKSDGFAEMQPIWITPKNDNPNGATTILMLAPYTPEDMAGYDLICDVFDGADDDALTAARARWKELKDTGLNPTYWQQSDKGWEKKTG